MVAEDGVIDVLLRRYEADAVVGVSDDVPAGRGMVLKKDVEPNSIIFYIPADALLNAKTFATDLHEDLVPSASRPSAVQGVQVGVDEAQLPSLGGEGLSSFETPEDIKLPLSSVQALTLLLTLWRRHSRRENESLSASSSQLPRSIDDFARTLPLDFDSVPLLWSLYADLPGSDGDQCRALLEALPYDSRKRLADVRKRFGGDAKVVYAVLRKRPNLLPSWSTPFSEQELASDVLYLDYYWAWMCVNSRCLYLPIGLKTRADNFTMAPIIDLINHTFDRKLESKVEYPDQGGMQIRAPKSDPKAFNVTSIERGEDGKLVAKEEWQRGCRAGDELFITYGPHSNEFLLAEYGFILPIVTLPTSNTKHEPVEEHLENNPYADVVVDDLITELLSTEPLLQAELKRELLTERGYWLDWTIHPTGEPSHRLVCALRLLALDLTLPGGTHDGDAQGAETAATLAALNRKGTKRLKVQHRSGMTEPGDGHQGASQTESQMAKISEWEAMVIGSRELIGEENEARARAILVRVCEMVLERSKQRRSALEQAFGLSPDQTEYTRSGGSKGRWHTSFVIVRTLLFEQEHIARIVMRHTQSTTEPW